jgi:hypothetical protein
VLRRLQQADLTKRQPHHLQPEMSGREWGTYQGCKEAAAVSTKYRTKTSARPPTANLQSPAA